MCVNRCGICLEHVRGNGSGNDDEDDDYGGGGGGCRGNCLRFEGL